jgi:hypothetical protein
MCFCQDVVSRLGIGPGNGIGGGPCIGFDRSSIDGTDSGPDSGRIDGPGRGRADASDITSADTSDIASVGEPGIAPVEGSACDAADGSSSSSAISCCRACAPSFVSLIKIPSRLSDLTKHPRSTSGSWINSMFLASAWVVSAGASLLPGMISATYSASWW